MSGGEVPHVVGLTAGSLLTLEVFSVPGRSANLVRLSLMVFVGFVTAGRDDRRSSDLGGFRAASPGCGSSAQTGNR